MSVATSMDAPVGTLGSRAARGSIFLIAAQGARSLALFGASIYLARLLPPAVYGVSALITSLIGVFTLVSDFGLFTATVQRKDLTERQLSTLFWVNAAIGALLMMLGMALSPVIAWSFADPQLLHTTMAMCPLLLLNGLRHQHVALLARRLQFGRLALAELAATIAGIIVAIASAQRGFGVYALIAQVLSTAAAETILFWIAAAWIPGRPALATDLRELWSFGSYLSLFQLLHYATRNVDNLLIGRFRGVYVLGLYSRAVGIMMLPHVAITLPLQRVLVAALARLQSDRPRFDKTYLQAVRSLAALSFPFGAGLCVLADEAVAIVLGPSFCAAVPLLRVLSLGAMLQPILHSQRWAFMALGQSRQLLRFSLWTVPLIVASFVIGLHWGAFGVALAYSGVSYGIVLPLGIFYCARTLELQAAPYLRMLTAPAIAAGLMAAALYGLRVKLVHELALPLAVRAPLLVATGVLLYALFLALLARPVFAEAALFLAALRTPEST